MVRIDEYQGQLTAWCPGCGNFGILEALKKALVDLKLEPHQVLIVSGNSGHLGRVASFARDGRLEDYKRT